MNSSALIGIALGILIGTVTAIDVLLLIRFAVWWRPSWQYLLSMAGQLLGLAVFWGGGTWATGHMLQVPDQVSMEMWYWVALLVSFLVPVLPMLFWLSLMVGQMTHIGLRAEIINRWGR